MPDPSRRDYVSKDGLPLTDYVRPANVDTERQGPSIPVVFKKNGELRMTCVQDLGGKKSEKQNIAEGLVGFCSGCKAQVQMTFPNGFDVKTLDWALSGKPVRALCPACEKQTEFLPAAKYLPHPSVMKNQRGAM